ncbi:MarR family transcriptional regulator [Methanococcoides sp. AM1]|uniref:helix-turn-helix transcriptional regulator n=1 Tax=Methanococcoides sp. AM1 TaxID=1201011 RepID=UPI001082B8FC|nr:MarR family transcriptional regulator [Methanococcoides sp. AM1]
MKIRTLFVFSVCILSCFFSAVPVSAEGTATIHGAIYEWDTFQLMENVIIEVNTTPPQSIVAKYGVYSMNLAPGEYLITATYYENNTLTASTQETITISDDGDYIIDLILLPSYDSDLTEDPDLLNITTSLEADSEAIENGAGDNTLYYVAVLIILLIAGSGLYLFSKKNGKKEEGEGEQIIVMEDMVKEATIETNSEFIAGVSDETDENDDTEELKPDAPDFSEVEEKTSLPSDLQEVLDIISSSGGRITQKELRSKLSYSEAKVSLIVSDLENRGLVEKFKKGRGNIIIIPDEQR